MTLQQVLYAIFVIVVILILVVLDIKIDKINKEIVEKDKLSSAFEVLHECIIKLSEGFKDNKRRLNDIEERLSLSREPEEPEKPEYTCKDCRFYHPYDGIGFANAVKYFKCEKIDRAYPIECNTPCHAFEKKDDLDILELVDDEGNSTGVWFQGKRYVPEDKKDKDAITFYADGKIVSEITRPEEKRCKHKYKGIVGNAKIEELQKAIDKLYHDYDTGLISAAEYSRRVMELMQ